MSFKRLISELGDNESAVDPAQTSDAKCSQAAKQMRTADARGPAIGNGNEVKDKHAVASIELLDLPKSTDEHHFLRRLLQDDGPSSSVCVRPEGGALTTEAVTESPLVARLRSFLPQMQQANERLAETIKEHGAQSVEIEATDEDSCHISMDLALGVIDLKDKAAVEAAERSVKAGESRCCEESDQSGTEADRATQPDSRNEGRRKGKPLILEM